MLLLRDLARAWHGGARGAAGGAMLRHGLASAALLLLLPALLYVACFYAHFALLPSTGSTGAAFMTPRFRATLQAHALAMLHTLYHATPPYYDTHPYLASGPRCRATSTRPHASWSSSARAHLPSMCILLHGATTPAHALTHAHALTPAHALAHATAPAHATSPAHALTPACPANLPSHP